VPVVRPSARRVYYHGQAAGNTQEDRRCDAGGSGGSGSVEASPLMPPGSLLRVLSAASVKGAARACGFPLVGLAPAEALEGGALGRWLASGHAADMAWMHERIEERLDPRRILPGARTVVALAIPHFRPDEPRGPTARYARGRDYHYVHRDRLRALRKALLAQDPALETYACVDTGPVMEKAWAERAGLGFIGKNGLLIAPGHGSHVTLSVLLVDRAVDRYDEPHPFLCGECTRCLVACPTDAFPAPGVVDARLCISYQTIENRGPVPTPLRPKLKGHVFGCDVCQDVCPFNQGDLPRGDSRLDPRPLGLMSAEEIAALSEEDWRRLSPGSALARAQYDGLRRNAVLAIGAAGQGRARVLLERLARDASPLVAEAARWALDELDARAASPARAAGKALPG
jgi:epoxyqueuosine reductase